jgi:hypothetical protein
MLECYINCDLLGCRTDTEQRTKIIKEISTPSNGDTHYVKEEWARLINTIASLRKGTKKECIIYKQFFLFLLKVEII